MTYTGYQDVKPDQRKPKLPVMLAHIDRGRETLGLRLDWPELDQARAYLARAAELRTAYREAIEQSRNGVLSAAPDYAAGNLTSAELIDQARTAALLSGDTGTQAQRMLEAAALAVEAEGAPLLHNVTETKWLKALRPAVTKALAVVNVAADEVGIASPRAATKNVAQHAHPWAPTGSELRGDMALRHCWERLEAALSDLDASTPSLTPCEPGACCRLWKVGASARTTAGCTPTGWPAHSVNRGCSSSPTATRPSPASTPPTR